MLGAVGPSTLVIPHAGALADVCISAFNVAVNVGATLPP